MKKFVFSVAVILFLGYAVSRPDDASDTTQIVVGFAGKLAQGVFGFLAGLTT